MAFLSQDLKDLTPQELMTLGGTHLAYIRPVTIEGKTGFGIFTADGRFLGAVEDLQTAFLTARQNELMPQNVH